MELSEPEAELPHAVLGSYYYTVVIYDLSSNGRESGQSEEPVGEE